jgi:YD repeat-containing protein
MAAKRARQKLEMSHEEIAKLEQLSVSRTEPYDRVTRARVLLAYRAGGRKSAIARRMGVSRPTVDLCIKKALCGGIDVALKDLPRSGRTNVITADDKTWVMSLACSKPTDHGYASEKWTLKQLAKHVRTHAQATGHPSLDRAGKATVQRILQENEIKPHKTAYYLERRDPEFEEKMAQVLFVYKEIEHGRLIGEKNEDRRETTVSYDEKPGIQAITNIAADLAPVSHRYTAWARDYEYKRLGTLSLLAGLDLHDGHVHALVRDRHRSREFTEFLEEMDHYYPSDWKIRVVLDNHSAHVSKQTLKWLERRPNRFVFVFTPKHASWLNMVEILFSKMARSFLRGIRVQSKEELVARMYRYIEEINNFPVIFRWKYKLDQVLI